MFLNYILLTSPKHENDYIKNENWKILGKKEEAIDRKINKIGHYDCVLFLGLNFPEATAK